jgi:hypothetical protein
MTPQSSKHYIDVGLALVPLYPQSKKPVGNEWQHRPITTLEQLQQLEGKNVGVHHIKSHTLAFDIDHELASKALGHIGINLEELLSKPGAKIVTPTAIKPIYRLPEGFEPATHQLKFVNPHNRAESITVFELRAKGQDVLPPSVHPNGTPYTWQEEPQKSDDIPELPEQLRLLYQHWDELEPMMQEVSPWYEPPKLKTQTSHQTKGHDNIISQFNNAVCIEALLERNGYRRDGQKYISPSSKTGLAGVVIFRDGDTPRCYSHHASDGLNDGHAHDAFDVMCLLECGGDFKQAMDKARAHLGLPASEAKKQHTEPLLKIEWQALQPLPDERPNAPTLPPEMLPDVLRPWLVDVASRACLPLEMLAAPALVALSGLIGRSAVIKPLKFSDWTVTPNLWGGVVAPPGSMKSDAISEAFRPLSKLEKQAREAHEKAMLEREVKKVTLETTLSAAKGRAKKGKASDDEIKSIITQLREVEAAPEKRYTTQDVTVEKLGEVLRDNPRGITVLRDELASWIASLEQEDNTTARGFFLTAWNGNSDYTFDRIGRGTTYIPGACVSVFGGIQPKPLDAVFNRLRNDPTRADGMLQRFQVMVYPDGLPEWHNPTSWPAKEARERAYKVFERLDRLEPSDSNESDCITLVFDNEAQNVFSEWFDTLEHRLRKGEFDRFPHFASHVAKYRSLAPSLAVIFHLVNLSGRETFKEWGGILPVSLEAVSLALDWTEFLELHARKIYSAEIHLEALAAHALAKKIREGKVTDGMTLRDIRRNQWTGLTGDALDIAIGELERLNWLKVVMSEPAEQGGRPSEVLRLHPDVRKVKA